MTIDMDAMLTRVLTASDFHAKQQRFVQENKTTDFYFPTLARHLLDGEPGGQVVFVDVLATPGTVTPGAASSTTYTCWVGRVGREACQSSRKPRTTRA